MILRGGGRPAQGGLFPAYAGVILGSSPCAELFKAFPRLRGGDPKLSNELYGGNQLFPAYAGVILSQSMSVVIEESFPRLRGGDPSPGPGRRGSGTFSPPTRG